MKKIIIERIKALKKEKQEQNRIPADPNELELNKDISELFRKELDSLIEEGIISVNGNTINKLRILSVK